MASGSRNNVFQFKISLKYIKPPIWRRVQVPADYTFKQLHYAIQDSMGWKSNFYDYHLHAFRMTINRQQIEIGISDKRFNDFMEIIPEEQTNVKDYFIEPKTKALYEYDFGQSWQHDVVLEKILPAVDGTAYPKCIAGRRACPPEDGVSSSEYEDDDEEEEHMERLENKKVRRDPENFDRDSVIFHEGDINKQIK